jgi:hypothetical protein
MLPRRHQISSDAGGVDGDRKGVKNVVALSARLHVDAIVDERLFVELPTANFIPRLTVGAGEQAVKVTRHAKRLKLWVRQSRLREQVEHFLHGKGSHVGVIAEFLHAIEEGGFVASGSCVYNENAPSRLADPLHLQQDRERLLEVVEGVPAGRESEGGVFEG